MAHRLVLRNRLEYKRRMRWLIRWVLSAVALLIVAHFVPGFYVRSFGWALVAAAVIGLVNATIGLLAKVVTFLLIVLTLGIFWFVVNAAMLIVASWIVPGFHISGFGAAFWGAVALAILHVILGWLVPERRRRED